MISCKNSILKNAIASKLRYKDIADLPYHWDFSDFSEYTESANRASAINNKGSIGGQLIQPTGINQGLYVPNAVNGLGVLRTNGDEEFMYMDNQVALQNFTFVLIQKFNNETALGATNTLFSWSNTTSLSGIEWEFTVFNFRTKGYMLMTRRTNDVSSLNGVAGNDIIDQNTHISMITVKDNPADAGVGTLYNDGVNSASVSNLTSYNANTTNMILASSQPGNFREYPGDFCELLIFGQTLNAVQRQQVLDIAVPKWNLTV